MQQVPQTAGRRQSADLGLGCAVGSLQPLAHLSNLKPTDPTAPRTRGLWTPARRRRCRAAGPAPGRTPPSWSCCRRPRWTWAGRGTPSAAYLDRSRRAVTSGSRRASSPIMVGSSGLDLPPNNTGGGNTSRPVIAILAPELESFLDIFKVTAPLRVTPVSLGVKHSISI